LAVNVHIPLDIGGTNGHCIYIGAPLCLVEFYQTPKRPIE